MKKEQIKSISSRNLTFASQFAYTLNEWKLRRRRSTFSWNSWIYCTTKLLETDEGEHKQVNWIENRITYPIPPSQNAYHASQRTNHSTYV